MCSRLGWPCLFIEAQKYHSWSSLQSLQSCAANLGACKGEAEQETLMWCSLKAVGESKLLRVFCEQRGSCTQAAFWQLSWAFWVQMHTEGESAAGRSSAQAGLVDGKSQKPLSRWDWPCCPHSKILNPRSEWGLLLLSQFSPLKKRLYKSYCKHASRTRWHCSLYPLCQGLKGKGERRMGQQLSWQEWKE